MTNELSKLMDPIVRLAKIAGEKIMYWYEHPEKLHTQKKPDKTSLTSADLSSHEILCDGLQALGLPWPILSEEGEISAFDVRSQWERYWLLDPLDGTQGFINGSDEFTVNIALIEGHRSILSVVYLPVKKHAYFAYRGGGAFFQEADQNPRPIQTQPTNIENIRFIVGRYHSSERMKRVLNQLPGSELLRVNSSLKLAWIAEGRADVYPRFGAISEWDIASGHCILEEAGGAIVGLNGKSLQYTLQESLLCPDFLAVGDPHYIDKWIHIFQSVA